ncbi:ABC transporter permease subunit [Kiritimatiellaeota bacterium B1221]|nr:ABC transporter permease subunit [Kiritimatiellaeota bacterium B1221]
MHSIFPIYKLTLRSILRERVALSMLALLALVLLLLPAGLETDGTIQGALRMHIRYSLGFSSFLVAAMTLWVSCASIAGDLSSKRLQMLLTKSVHRAEVWWGKWLAVVTLVSILMLICGGVTYLRIQHMVKTADLTRAEKAEVHSQFITARKPVDADYIDFSDEAEAMAEAQIKAGAVPENFPKEQLVSQMEHYLRVSQNAASAGEFIPYTFQLPHPLVLGSQFQISYEYDGASMGNSTAPGAWHIDLPGKQDVQIFETEENPYGTKVIEVTVDEKLAGASNLTLRFENRSEESGRVFFKTDQGVRLFFGGGSFSLNLFRALLLLCGMLALLAAIGVSAGSVFSLPVACYVSAVVLLMQSFSGTVEEVVAAGAPVADQEESILTHGIKVFQYKVFEGVLVVLKPLQMESPLGRVSKGITVSAGEMSSVFLLRFAPVVLLISGVGIFLFSRREIGAAV